MLSTVCYVAKNSLTIAAFMTAGAVIGSLADSGHPAEGNVRNDLPSTIGIFLGLGLWALIN